MNYLFFVFLFISIIVYYLCSYEYLIFGFIASILIPKCSTNLFSTNISTIPVSLNWKQPSFAKEMINILEKTVVYGAGDNPIPDAIWQDFSPTFPWQKNINRKLIFNKTSFLRSPRSDIDCEGKNCIKQIEYKNYTWIEIAEPICVHYIPERTNLLKPEKGFLTVKTIIKCQIILFETFYYQLTDNQGNYYAMHAYETDELTTNVILPAGFTIQKVELNSPLIIGPFGGGNECFFNIVGDHLGQGYHQYIFADKFYPN